MKESYVVGSEAPLSDEAAFQLLIEKNQARLVRYVYGLVRQFQDAQDITQEVFLRAYKARRQLRSLQASTSWLFAIAVNLVRDYYRRKGETTSTDSIEVADSGEWAELLSQGVGERVMVAHALAKVPHDVAACLLLHEVEGFTAREIAVILRIKPDAARQRIVRARKLFKQRYEALSKEVGA